jgi:alginate O-acetyltransferase complex protein AlgI
VVFSSIVFLFLFLPVVLSAYFLCPRAVRNYLLLAASLFFYAWGETTFVLVMLGSIALNYIFGLWIDRARGTQFARLPMVLGILVNLEILALYKYSTFFIDNLNYFLGWFGAAPVMLEGRHLPIGISFFTFQAMSYIIDVYREDAKPQKNPLNLALYIALFPQLIAGPIVRYQQIASELLERQSRLSDVAEGVKRFIIGLGKKVLIANTVATGADAIFALPADELTTPLAWFGIGCYTLQIYFDFSGYSDMAIGLGRIFGFHFLENFQWPYIAQSIQEFWRRWHISLSSWYRDYLYIPLGGSRGGTGRTAINLVTVFFLCGLWHGAAWNFAIWGLYHGAFLVLERGAFGAWLARWPRPLRHGYVMLVVIAGWVLFRVESIISAKVFFLALAGFAEGSSIVRPLPLYCTPDIVIALTVGCVGATPILPAVRGYLMNTSRLQFLVPYAASAAYMALLYACAVVLSAQTYNPFIYFRF